MKRGRVQWAHSDRRFSKRILERFLLDSLWTQNVHRAQDSCSFLWGNGILIRPCTSNRAAQRLAPAPHHWNWLLQINSQFAALQSTEYVWPDYYVNWPLSMAEPSQPDDFDVSKLETARLFRFTESDSVIRPTRSQLDGVLILYSDSIFHCCKSNFAIIWKTFHLLPLCLWAHLTACKSSQLPNMCRLVKRIFFLLNFQTRRI